MKERAFNARPHEVRGLLGGRVTQLRRVVKDARGPFWDHAGWVPSMRNDGVLRWVTLDGVYTHLMPSHRCHLGQPGDRLWCREAWGFSVNVSTDSHDRYMSERDASYAVYRADTGQPASMWRSSTQMPRWASRLTLEVLDVRVQRLRDVTGDDVIAEGFASLDTGRPVKSAYAVAWDAHNKRHPWASNPWTWVAQVKVLEVRR